MNRGFGGWVSSLIILYYDHVSAKGSHFLVCVRCIQEVQRQAHPLQGNLALFQLAFLLAVWRRDSPHIKLNSYQQWQRLYLVELGKMHYCCCAEGRRFDLLFRWLNATQLCDCNTCD